MKKMIITMSLLLTLLATRGQIVNVESIERLNVPTDESKTAQAVAISPRGDYLLLSTDNKQGLVKWDIATAHATVLTTEPVTGSDVNISQDGQEITYEEVSYQDRRRHQAVKSINLVTGERKTLVPDKRLALPGDALDAQRSVLTHHHLKLYITRNGKTRQLAPIGEDERYIWPSLSPDGTKVLYYVGGWGAGVCDLDGNNVISLGDITAPMWWDDNTIVGMIEVDNEYTVIASSIVMRTLDGTEQTLTGDDVIATYPLPCRQDGKIAFSTPAGEIYVIAVSD